MEQIEQIFSYEVEADQEGRVDGFLAKHCESASRSYIQKLIKEEKVTVNALVVKANYKVQVGDKVCLTLPKPEELKVAPENIPLDIVYEDADILIINKPKKMVVHPGAGHINGTLVNALLYHCKDQLSGINGVMRPGIVHRIDMDTTGLLVVCKNDNAHRCLSEQLKVHSITRRYEMIVFGNIKEDEGTIEGPIGRHPVERKKMAINPKNGKPAVTHYKVLQRFGQYTYVQCELETGRTHQIRVHMSSIHHPLLGDKIYGPDKQPFSLEGQCLHAGTLGFLHPTSGTYVEFHSELPEYFKDLLIKLEKKKN